MPLTVKTVSVDLKGAIGAEASKALASYARYDRDRRIAAKEVSQRYDTFVDGVEGISEERVKPGGEIRYRFSGFGDIVPFALQALRDRAPRVTGGYASGFRIMVGRAQRLIRLEDFDAAQMGDYRAVAIVNIEPYSRKLDVQAEGTRPIKVRAPAFFFTAAAEEINARYGNSVRAYRRNTSVFPGRHRTKAGRLVEYPTLIITLR